MQTLLPSCEQTNFTNRTTARGRVKPSSITNRIKWFGQFTVRTKRNLHKPRLPSFRNLFRMCLRSSTSCELCLWKSERHSIYLSAMLVGFFDFLWRCANENGLIRFLEE